MGRGARSGARALLLAALACGGNGAPPLVLGGAAMGTTWSVKIAQPLPPGLAPETLRARLEGVLERVEGRMSTWRADSELSRFNRSRSGDWFPVSAETAHVVSESLRLAELSKGAFDPSVAPLVSLWGFGSDGPQPLPPPAARLAGARARVGHGSLGVRSEPPALRKRRPDLEIDLSAIAKGHAVDALASRLEETGVADYLVEIGGELSGRGAGPAGGGWRVAVERPPGRGEAQAVVALDGRAIATSGDYRSFRVQDGVRHGHLLDPRTGQPVRHALVSVSVIAETALRADGLATALAVLGPEAGWALAAEQRLAVLFVERSGRELASRSSAEFDRQRLPSAARFRMP